MKVRRKPIDQDAVQFDGTNHEDVHAFLGRHGCMYDQDHEGFTVHTGQGTIVLRKNNVLIASPNDQVSVIPPDVFAADFDVVVKTAGDSA